MNLIALPTVACVFKRKHRLYHDLSSTKCRFVATTAPMSSLTTTHAPRGPQPKRCLHLYLLSEDPEDLETWDCQRLEVEMLRAGEAAEAVDSVDMLFYLRLDQSNAWEDISKQLVPAQGLCAKCQAQIVADPSRAVPPGAHVFGSRYNVRTAYSLYTQTMLTSKCRKCDWHISDGADVTGPA